MNDSKNRSIPRALGYLAGTLATKVGAPEFLEGVRMAWPLPPPLMAKPANPFVAVLNEAIAQLVPVAQAALGSQITNVVNMMVSRDTAVRMQEAMQRTEAARTSPLYDGSATDGPAS